MRAVVLRIVPLDVAPELEAIVTSLVDAFGEVRRELGVGLVEAVYVECLTEELGRRGLQVQREVEFPVIYRGRVLPRRLRVDLLVEAKAVEALHPAHFAQFLTYLRMSGKPLGALVNFHAVPLGEGIHRRVNTRPHRP